MKLYQSIKRFGAVPVSTGLCVLASFPVWASEASNVTPTD